MSDERRGNGPLLSAIGPIVLAVAVFLPWYAVSLTASGVAAVERLGDQFALRYGTPALQGQLAKVHATLSGLSGHELGSVSAHQALSRISVVLLVLAGLAILFALRPLAGSDALLPEVPPSWGAALGVLAALLVLYRMIQPPGPEAPIVAISLRGGAWLALGGCLAMIAGGMWPRRLRAAPVSGAARVSTRELERAWSKLSGWTPGD